MIILADIYLSNIKAETRRSFFQRVQNIPRNDVKTTAKNSVKPSVPLVFLLTLTKNTYFYQFLKLSNQKKEKINEDNKELEEIIFPSYTSFVQQVESDAAKVKEDYQSLKQRIENQRNKWHIEIDKIFDLLQNETEEMRDIQMKALNEHLQKVKELRSGIQKAINLNKDLLYSHNVTETLSYRSKNVDLKFYPEKLEVSVPCFISQPINGYLIAEMFGVIVGFSISEKIELYKKKPQTIGHRIYLDKPYINSVLDTEIKYPEKITCQGNKIWIAGNEGSLKLFKCKGLLSGSGSTSSPLTLKHVNVNKGPTDIAITRSGDLIYGIKLENIVFIFNKDKAEVLINLHDWKLLSLCITAFGELLVCMTDERKYRCRVVRFNQDLEIRQIIQYDHRGRVYTHQEF